MIDFFADNFSTCVFVAVLLVALIPTLESKIAIPLALSNVVWGDGTLSPALAIVACLVSGTVASVVVVLICKKLKTKASGFVYERFYQNLKTRFSSNVEKVNSKPKSFYKLWTLAMFVAIPLPLTGVYTGSVIAGLSNLKTIPALFSIFFGNLISCIIMTLLCVMFENSAFYILLASLALIIIYVLITLIHICVNLIRKNISKKKV